MTKKILYRMDEEKAGRYDFAQFMYNVCWGNFSYHYEFYRMDKKIGLILLDRNYKVTERFEAKNRKELIKSFIEKKCPDWEIK